METTTLNNAALDFFGASSSITTASDAAKYFASKHWAQPRKARIVGSASPLRCTFKVVGGRRTYAVRYCTGSQVINGVREAVARWEITVISEGN